MSATQKLVQKGVKREIAEKLASNNILTPRAIRNAKTADLTKITGLSTAKANELKALFAR